MGGRGRVRPQKKVLDSNRLLGQANLERRFATRQVRSDPFAPVTDTPIEWPRQDPDRHQCDDA
jgi:hypothetical protein